MTTTGNITTMSDRHRTVLHALFRSPLTVSLLALLVALVCAVGVWRAHQDALAQPPLVQSHADAGTTAEITIAPPVLPLTVRCVRVSWQVEGVQAVTFDGNPRVGTDARDLCFDRRAHDLPELELLTPDDMFLRYPIVVPRTGVAPFAGMVAALVVAGYALVFPLPGLRLLLRLLPAFGILAVFLVTGWRGLDFGNHWDEVVLEQAAQDAYAAGVFVPQFYQYPSVSYWLTVAGKLPSALQTTHPVSDVSRDMATLRVGFLAVTSLIVLWTYGAALVLRRTVWEATLAGALVGLSWEIAYHARWIAPDAIMAQFAALTLLLLVAAWRWPGQRGYLYGAAVGAALATGTKYPAGALLLPVLVTLWRVVTPASPRQLARQTAYLLAVFGLAYLLTTPGTLLAPVEFFRDLSGMVYGYADGETRYDIAAGLPHLLALLEYYALALFSPFRPVAAGLFALVLVGGVALWREDRGLLLVVAIFPLFYTLYFAQQSKFIVRNMLIVAPFLALLATVGAGALMRALPGRWWRYALVGVIVVGLLANAGWLVWTAETVQQSQTQTLEQTFIDYAEVHTDTPLAVSAELYERLQLWADLYDTPLPPNVVRFTPDGPDRRYYLAAELIEPLPYTGAGKFVRVIGPQAVNMDYYHTWTNPLIVAVDVSRVADRVAPDDLLPE